MDGQHTPHWKGSVLQTHIGALLHQLHRRVDDTPTVAPLTVLQQPVGKPHAVHAVEGVIFGFETSRGLHTEQITIHIGDSTGVMAIDLNLYRDREAVETLATMKAQVGTCVKVAGKVIADAYAFPIFQASQVVSNARPTVRNLRAIAQALAIHGYPEMRKSQLAHAVKNAQQELYCGIHFLSGQGTNHAKCGHA